MSNTARYVLETFTALTMDGGGQSIGVIDTTRPAYGYVATFSQGWEQSAQAYVDGLNAEDAKMTNLVEAAHSMDRADRNAQRYYRAARTVDLRRWLSPTYENASPVDPWTKARRTRLMRAELASREAELCRSHDHYDRFGGANENVASHVAAHQS